MWMFHYFLRSMARTETNNENKKKTKYKQQGGKQIYKIFNTIHKVPLTIDDFYLTQPTTIQTRVIVKYAIAPAILPFIIIIIMMEPQMK